MFTWWFSYADFLFQDPGGTVRADRHWNNECAIYTPPAPAGLHDVCLFLCAFLLCYSLSVFNLNEGVELCNILWISGNSEQAMLAVRQTVSGSVQQVALFGDFCLNQCLLFQRTWIYWYMIIILLGLYGNIKVHSLKRYVHMCPPSQWVITTVYLLSRSDTSVRQFCVVINNKLDVSW